MTDRLKISGTVGSPLNKPSRRSPLSRWGLALLAGTILVVVLKLIDWTAELLWFRALGYEDVFWRLRFAKVAMFAVAFIPVFVYVRLNLLVLARFADLRSLLGGGSPPGMSQSWPSHSGTGIAQSNTRQLTPLFILASATTAAIFGFAFYGEWDRSLRLVWAQDSGMSDPIYLRDIGFYLFVLPFLELVQNSLVLLTLGGTLLLELAYFWMGGLRFGGSGYVATDPKALRHVIANTVLLLTAWNWGFYLDRFGLLTRSAGAVLALATRMFTSCCLACGSR